jgi:hypothetical protein
LKNELKISIKNNDNLSLDVLKLLKENNSSSNNISKLNSEILELKFNYNTLKL